MSRRPKGTQLELRRRKIFKNRDEYKRTTAYIYLIGMKNPEWGFTYKVGVSTNPHSRLSRLAKESNSLITLLLLQEGIAYDIYMLELNIHIKYRGQRSLFKGMQKTFGGYTECFHLSDDDVLSIKCRMSTFQI